MLKRVVTCLCAVMLSAAGAGEVKLQPKGIEISNGALQFIMPFPQPGQGNKWAAVKKISDSEVLLDYGGNRVLKCAVKDHVITITPVSEAAKTSYRMETRLPLSWGGKTKWTALRVSKLIMGTPAGNFSTTPYVAKNGQWALYDAIAYDLAFQQGKEIIQLNVFTHWNLKDNRQWHNPCYSFSVMPELKNGNPLVIKVAFPKELQKPTPKSAVPVVKPPLCLTDRGVAVNFGPFSTNYPFPIFNYGAHWQKLIHPKKITVSPDGQSSVADYGEKRFVTCRLDGDTLIYTVSPAILTDKKYGAPWLELNINEIFSQNGGAWAFVNPFPGSKGVAVSKFPRDKAPLWYSYAGGADGCRVTTADGKGDEMLFMSRGLYYLKDCRLWGKFWFALCCRPDVRNGTFKIKINFRKGAASKVIDEFGQFVNFDFPEKVRSVKELKDDVERDKAYYASLPKSKRTYWGGLPGSKEKYGLKATGFFHLEKVPALHNRVCLVEPEGNLYFHIGMSGLHRGNETTCVLGREDIYQALPPYDGPEAAAWYWRPPRGKAVSYYVWNWVRKYGKFDHAQWQKEMIERCRCWGFNAFGEFTRIYGDNAQSGFAITRCIEHYANRKPFNLVCRDFIDPYDAKNLPLLEEDFAEQAKPWVGKPILIGYYTENERFYNIVVPAILRKTGNSPAKVQFAAMMKQRYRGDFNAFNAVWKTPAKSFDELVETTLYAEKYVANAKASEDLSAFEFQFFDDYFALLSRTLKKVDPDHLYLGERMLIAQTYNDAVVKAMGKYCDVFSVNHYTDDYDPADVERFAKISGLPVMLSEWSFGSHDQGLYGAKNKANDDERGKAYSRYAENAAAGPYVVGFQWFIFLDESNTGRGFNVTNGERFNMGFVNVCDRPYKKFAGHAACSNHKIYDLLTGNAKPVPPVVSGVRAHETRIMPVGRVKPGYSLNALREKYPGRPGEGITRSVAGRHPSKDDKADMICGWDENFLYVLLTIQDKTPASNNHNQAIWMGDSVEFFYGPYVEKPGKMRANDRQVAIRGNTSPDSDFRWDCGGSQLKGVPRPKSFVRVAPDGKSWAIEVALPWKEIGIKPRTGMKVAFDAGINLSGSQNNVQANKLMWNGEETNYYRRDLWGVIVLED